MVTKSEETLDRILGCMYGLALGDALGWPVEFAAWEHIRERYGENGIQGFDTISIPYEYTDDTQMSIATALGLLDPGDLPGDPLDNIAERYIDWLDLQSQPGGSRAPGGTCLSAVGQYSRTGEYGTMEKPINDSKGCGGVMRTAPIGLIYPPDKAFRLGAEAAALTHGHPSGYLPAGFLSAVIAAIMEGSNLSESYDVAKSLLLQYPEHEETLWAVEQARGRALLFGFGDPLGSEPGAISNTVEDTVQDIETLFGPATMRGGGWVGEEALAIALYCAFRNPNDFAAAVVMGANHTGDADSTASITGAIVGALVGASGIRQDWIENVEDSDFLTDIGVYLNERL